MATGVLADEFKSRENSLNALRLALALLVILSHAPLIVGAGDPFRWADLEIGGWAVAGFFAISGWLITTSRLNLSFSAYLWRRCLRILPAFWVVLLLTVLVFAPLAAWRTGEWPDGSSAVSYAWSNVSLWIFQPTIDGSLQTAPTSVWNLSLWTLFWEMLCYLGLGVLLSFRSARTHPSVIALVFVVLTTSNALVRILEVGGLSPALNAGLRLGSFFAAGALLRMYAERIPVSRRVAVTCGLAIAAMWPLGLVGALGALPLAYLSLYAAIKLPFDRVGRRNDVSYGVYIYAFPVGQLLALSGNFSSNVLWFTILNGLVVLPLAWASWLCVEKPALRLKGLVPAVTAPASPQHPTQATSG